MSTALLDRIVGDVETDQGSFFEPQSESVEPVSSRAAREADWFHEDPVDELLAQLAHLGRAEEARAIARIIEEAEEAGADLMFRALASDAFAEDWESEEDSYYDSL